MRLSSAGPFRRVDVPSPHVLTLHPGPRMAQDPAFAGYEPRGPYSWPDTHTAGLCLDMFDIPLCTERKPLPTPPTSLNGSLSHLQCSCSSEAVFVTLTVSCPVSSGVGLNCTLAWSLICCLRLVEI